MNDFGLLFGFFAFVMVAVTTVGYLYQSRTPGKARPTVLAGNVDSQPEASLLAEPELPNAQAFFARTFRRIGETLPAAKEDKNPIRKSLIAAGFRYPSAVPIFYGIKAAVAVLLGGVLALFAVLNGNGASGLLTALSAGGGFGFLLPDRILTMMTRARAGRIRRAIPAALDMIVLSVEAGQSLNAAILETSVEIREAYPDLSAELAQVHLELRAGDDRSNALLRLGVRNNEPELRKLASVLIDSDRFGTALAPALRTHAHYLRLRMRQQAQETARKVPVKLVFPVFFLIFPSVLLVTLGPAVMKMMQQLRLFVGQ